MAVIPRAPAASRKHDRAASARPSSRALLGAQGKNRQPFAEQATGGDRQIAIAAHHVSMPPGNKRAMKRMASPTHNQAVGSPVPCQSKASWKRV